MDGIWFLRNKIVHESINSTVENFVDNALKIFKDYRDAWGSKQMTSLLNWKAIPKDHYLLTFDVAARTRGSTTAAVCKSEGGALVFVFTSFIKSQNSNQESYQLVLTFVNNQSKVLSI
ncbi:hypothetical protein F2P56_017067 [Juglans regia]|uniref:Uncharacterized protein n=1 Tax=Juglans regia TaxID=51240 RepID=A0A833XIU1_JUGRE|nr:hypothetical protein F2P56_017067 [Juglans regia]